MGCDRNLFTLRLVLNQMEGEWQWQAAAERGRRWVGRMRVPKRSACVCVWRGRGPSQIQQYNPHLPHAEVEAGAKGQIQGPPLKWMEVGGGEQELCVWGGGPGSEDGMPNE